MNAESQMIKQVIANVTEAGYKIVSIISDNNVINRKSFILLRGSETLKPFIINPLNNEKIFLLFDTVHLLKCIRNNWLNLKGDQKRTFLTLQIKISYGQLPFHTLKFCMNLSKLL